MNRRNFLAASLVGVAGIESVEASEPPTYRRFDNKAGDYKPCAKIDVKAGDGVWIVNEPPSPKNSPWGVYLCCEDARRIDGVVTFAVSHWMNEAGEWVSF